MFFAAERRISLKKEQPDLSFSEVAKVRCSVRGSQPFVNLQAFTQQFVGAEWKTMDSEKRLPYMKKAQDDKERHKREMAAFERGEFVAKPKPKRKPKPAKEQSKGDEDTTVEDEDTNDAEAKANAESKAGADASEDADADAEDEMQGEEEGNEAQQGSPRSRGERAARMEQIQMNRASAGSSDEEAPSQKGDSSATSSGEE